VCDPAVPFCLPFCLHVLLSLSRGCLCLSLSFFFLFCLSFHRSIFLFIDGSFFPSFWPPVSLSSFPFFCLSVSLSFCLSIFLSFLHISICLSLCLSVYLAICLSLSLFPSFVPPVFVYFLFPETNARDITCRGQPARPCLLGLLCLLDLLASIPLEADGSRSRDPPSQTGQVFCGCYLHTSRMFQDPLSWISVITTDEARAPRPVARITDETAAFPPRSSPVACLTGGGRYAVTRAA